MKTTTRMRKPLAINDCWLYAISSKADLAYRLSPKDCSLTVNELEQLSVDAGNFKLFSIRQGDKNREVQEPKRDLQKLHSRIHKLLARVQVPTYLHSAVKGKSYLSNARAHNPVSSTIKIDVKKFFPSVPRRTIFRFFEQTMHCRRDVAGMLADILTFDARLPTGSSASPIIAYYAFKPMFDELSMYAERHGLIMTCYVDDITMSGDGACRSILFDLHKIISRHGLKSHKKKFFSGQSSKVITGVCNAPSGERVPNKLLLKISNGFKELSTTTSSDKKQKTLSVLLGRMEAARQIDPTFGARARTLRAQMRNS